MEQGEHANEYICIQALEDGVMLIGMTRGKDTKLLHTERLEAGEVVIAQFTENTSAMKIRGRAKIWTHHGTLVSGIEKE